MKLLDPAHPFFRPAWRRWLTVLLPGAWAMVEFASGAMFWGFVFAAASAYAAYMLILTFPKDGA